MIEIPQLKICWKSKRKGHKMAQPVTQEHCQFLPISPQLPSTHTLSSCLSLGVFPPYANPFMSFWEDYILFSWGYHSLQLGGSQLVKGRLDDEFICFNMNLISSPGASVIFRRMSLPALLRGYTCRRRPSRDLPGPSGISHHSEGAWIVFEVSCT